MGFLFPLTFKQTVCFGSFGFFGALPFVTLLSTFGIHLAESGAEPHEIGFYTLVTWPYILKSFLGPWLDRFTVTVFGKFLGPRKGPAVFSQIVLCVVFFSFGCVSITQDFYWMFFLSFLMSFAATVQDLSLEAYRIEKTPAQGVGASAWSVSMGFRFGFFVAGGGTLYLADLWTWKQVYQVLAFLMMTAPLFVLWSDPDSVKKKSHSAPPFFSFWAKGCRDLFSRMPCRKIIMLMVCMKMTDVALNVFTGPFLIHMGYGKMTIALISKGWGFALMFAGHSLCGIFLSIFSIRTTVLTASALQLCAVILYSVHSTMWALGIHPWGFVFFSVLMQQFAAAFTLTSLLAFSSRLTRVPYTALQYGFLSSLSSFIRIACSALMGALASLATWELFFPVLTVLQILGLLAAVCLFRNVRARKKIRL